MAKRLPSPPPRLRQAAAPHQGLPRAPDGPFSRPFVVDRLRTDTETDIEVSADEAEREALAELDGLERVDRLEGRFRITRHGASVRVRGEIEADIVQTCVVTLEPFPAHVREPVEVRYAPETEVAALEAASARAGGDPFEDVADTADIPDPIVDGRIDLGMLAAEFLALGLDPHPRKPGATFSPETSGPAVEPIDISPFAALRARDVKT